MSGETKETLSGRIPRELKARCVALAEQRNVAVTVVMTEALEAFFRRLEGSALNGHAVSPASPPTVVGGQAVALDAHLQAILAHCRAHARANRQAAQAVIGSLLADSSDEHRAAAREFLERSFAGLEPDEEQS